MIHLRSTMIRIPVNARSAATVPKMQPHTSSLPSKLLTSRPSQSKLNEQGFSHPHSENRPGILSRSSKSNYKERGFLPSDRTFSVGNKSNTTGINRWRTDQSERKSGRVWPKQVQGDLHVPSAVSVGQLARLLNVRLRTLQRTMDQVGMHTESSYDYVLTYDYAALLVQEFGRNPIMNNEAAFDLYPPSPSENIHLLPSRPPVVAIMGHVDHGKTTLLDKLRSSSVAASEAGGITQHIGAFCLPLSMNSNSSSTAERDERLITFLDTPGHAAFSAMRVRGVSATDIVVLVVAADDGVMPQTLEVIELFKREKERSNIGMVVAINKADKPEANVEKTKLALISAGVPLEECGGDIPCVTVSGLTGSGLPDLVETIALVADMMDLRAERDCTPVGYILESRILKGFGPVATILMTRGTLCSGMPLLAGTSSCSTRRLLSPALQSVTSASPGTPVLVTGWKSLPAIGEEVLSGSEIDIKKACINRERRRGQEFALGDVEAINTARQADKGRGRGRERLVTHQTKRCNHPRSLEAENHPVSHEVERKYLRIVVKGDVSGSVEALVGAVENIGNQSAGVKVVSTGVGDVSDSDVMMAKAANAIIVAFSVCVPRAVQASASQNHVLIYTSDIIYRIIDDVRDRVISLLPCTYDIEVIGEAKVLQLFEVQIKGSYKKIAGCRVNHGILQRSSLVRVLRAEEIIYEGSVDALRQSKKEVSEVRKGSECGVNLQDFDNLQEGDIIQTFRKVKMPGEL